MIRRMLCLLCTALLLFSACPATAEEAQYAAYSYDFDLTFSLNADAYPARTRVRAAGYAELLGALGLKGNITLCPERDSMDLNATLYYTGKPDLAYPFRLYGSRTRLFFTSPLLDDSLICLDLLGLLEFAVKAKNTLNMPLTTLALLYPYVTEMAFAKLAKAWTSVIRPSSKSRKITVKKIEALSEKWRHIVETNQRLSVWVMAVMDISEAPAAVESIFSTLPDYCKTVSGGNPLYVTVEEGSETWRDSTGNTLCVSRETADSRSLELKLPAAENGYVPALSLSSHADEQSSSFSLSASLTREVSSETVSESFFPEENGVEAVAGGTTPAGEDEDEILPEVYEDEVQPEVYEDEAEPEVYEEVDEQIIYDEFPEYEDDVDDVAYSEYGEYGSYSELGEYGEYGGMTGSMEWPDLLLRISAEGSGLPRTLPADSDFSVSAAILGAVYPDTAYTLFGQTKKDGTVELSLCNPAEDGADPVEVFHCSGSLIPVEPESVPDYKTAKPAGDNVFSFNEPLLADFVSRMLPLALRSALSFVEAAPTSACQSFLDDMTDLGVIDMLLQ